MTEINGPKFNVNPMSFQNIRHSAQEIPTETQEEKNNLPQITDFSDPKAEALGRSMIFKGVDDTNNDLKALLENPQIAENSDKLFEQAYQTAQENGLENPYEEAAEASTTSM